jgi:excisionase family DNA binding protein
MRQTSQIETGEREWMDLSALTRYASVSERTLREWIHRPDNPLPAVRVGAKLLISRTKFDRWLESHSVVNSVDIQAMVDEVLHGIAEAR